MDRIDKLLAGTGRWSRKDAKKLIKEGRVEADGRRIKSSDEKVSPDQVYVDGERVVCGRLTYIMLNKPAGLLSATEDKRQETVISLLPAHLQRLGLFPVGRLDKDTEGLLLLTDDGPLAHRLLSPSRHVDKVYYAETMGQVTEEDAAAFEKGIVLADGMECMPAGLKPLEPYDEPWEFTDEDPAAGQDDTDKETGAGPEKSFYIRGRCLVTLREGKFHQVKRMLAHCGKPVLYLKRLSMGSLELDPDLGPGQWRMLTEEEEKNLLSVGKNDNK